MSISSTDSSLRELRSGGKLTGSIRVPGDKSISHRALLFGAIAEGTTLIEGLLPAEDPISTANCLRAMGVNIGSINEDQLIQVEGVGLDGLCEPNDVLNCGNSGTTMRLMIGLLAGRRERNFILTGDASLRSRPMQRVAQPLKVMGAQISGRKNANFAPLSISGKALRGAVIGTPVASAQVKSALLLAALTAEGPTTVIEPAHSRDHSERMLRAFGANLEIGGEMGRHISIRPGASLKSQKVVVPGDISSAGFWLVGGALLPGSHLTINNVGLNPTRTGILQVMEEMEARIDVVNQREVAGEPVGDLVVSSGPLKPFTIGHQIIPQLVDEIPILAVAACFCDGISKISGASELRVKETDRLAVMARQLKAMGADIEEHADGLTINGGESTIKGAALDSETDHRVAMSLAIASLLAEGDSVLRGSNAAAVSYPTFWEELERLHN